MILRNGKRIVNGDMPYIVAELNSSHNGKVSIAREMIDVAKDCGCDAVKFQSWSAESLYCQDYYDKNPISRRMVHGFSLKPGELLELAEYCGEIGIDFSSTPYSEGEVDFLVEKCRAPFVKIASMDINNLPYLRYIAQKKIAVVLSTGMATVEEIEAAVAEMEDAGNRNICLLHCVSLYPTDVQAVNLNNMAMLKERFPDYAVGYSDHTIGSEAACASVGLGAALIEKHFTLSHEKIGWDNQMATEPADMKELVDVCRRAYKCLGTYERRLTSDEIEQQKKMRRSIVAAIDMSKGHRIEGRDLTAKRPGDGISVSEYKSVIGQVLNRDVQRDQLILEEYFADCTMSEENGEE